MSHKRWKKQPYGQKNETKDSHLEIVKETMNGSWPGTTTGTMSEGLRQARRKIEEKQGLASKQKKSLWKMQEAEWTEVVSNEKERPDESLNIAKRWW